MYKKYPKTPHLPYSESFALDDTKIDTENNFRDVVVTIKMDGECSTIYPNGYFHARSIDGNFHPSQSYLKKYLQEWYSRIPNDWRVCGENLYAKHSIEYTFDDPKEYFQVFGIVTDEDYFLAWEDTELWCELIEVNHVPVIYKGIYNKDSILTAYDNYRKTSTNETEGFVVRNSNAFSFEEFYNNVAKYVRKNHVQTNAHWRTTWVPNKLKVK